MIIKYVYIGKYSDNTPLHYGDVFELDHDNHIVYNCTNNRQYLCTDYVRLRYSSIFFSYTSVYLQYHKIVDKLEIVCNFLIYLDNIRTLRLYGKGIYLVTGNFDSSVKIGDIISDVIDTSFLLNDQKTISPYLVDNLNTFTIELKDLKCVEDLYKEYSATKLSLASDINKIEKILNELKKEL